MPIYEYRCKECHQVFEEWSKSAEEAAAPSCPVCDSRTERIISNTAFVLKGSGWYATDYGNRRQDPKAPAESPATPPAAQGDAPSSPALSPPSATPAEGAAKSAGAA